MLVKIGYSQMEVKTGDIAGNLQSTKTAIESMKEDDFIVFPEMNISGYNCGDLFEKKKFIEDCRNAINEIVDESSNHNAVVIIGAPRHDRHGDLYNSAFVIHAGKIIGIYDKQLLANDYHHEDRKYFKAGNHSKIFYLKGVKFGILICEDGWKSYGRDIAREMADDGAEFLISINYSYFTFNKIEDREFVFKNDRLPMLYVNAVGVGDITKNFICYDGGSFVYNPYGKPKFELQLGYFHEAYGEATYNTVSRVMHGMGINFINDMETKCERIIAATTYAIRHIFRETGIKKAQIHMSGGVDSAVVAYLATRAIGVDNCIFITQPSKNNGAETLEVAANVVNALGGRLEYSPIKEYIDIYKRDEVDASPAQVACFEATLRKALGFSYTHRNKSGILACGNHTENVLGWFTFADIGSMGVMQPIGDMTKMEIFELCEHINTLENKEIIPKKLYDGSMKPSAELEDSSEDPFDYYLMSHICERIVRFGQTPVEIISSMKIDIRFKEYTEEIIHENVMLAWKKSKFSVYKRAQSAPVLILSSRSIGFSSRETIINHYK